LSDSFLTFFLSGYNGNNFFQFKLNQALLLALVSRWNERQANVPAFEAPSLSRGIVHNGLLVAGGQIKTFALSTAIKIDKQLHTSMTHSPARLRQAFVSGSFQVSVFHF
jgi:hypothetical protein